MRVEYTLTGPLYADMQSQGHAFVPRTTEGYSTASLPIQTDYIRTESPTRLCEDAFSAMAIDHPQSLRLPSIRDMLSTEPNDSRRGSTASQSSSDSYTGHGLSTSPFVDAGTANGHVANRRLRQVYHHTVPLAQSHRTHPYWPTPSASPVLAATVPFVTKPSKSPRSKWHGKKPRNQKAEREYLNRKDSAYEYSYLQAEVFEINPNMAKLAVPMPGKTALTPLKSNNVASDVQNPLLYNKNDMLNTSTCALRHSRELFECNLHYLENIDQPGALPPHEAAAAIRYAAAHRGCVDFELPVLLVPQDFRAKL